MRTLTVKECQASQVKREDSYGTKHPYKGLWYSTGSPTDMVPVRLPPCWVMVHIPAWGLYIRKITDQDYTKDL